MLRHASTSRVLRQLLPGLQSGSAAFSSATQQPITATLFPGDGIGPEIAEALQEIFKAAGAPIEWDVQHIGTQVCVSFFSEALVSPHAAPLASSGVIAQH